MDAIIEGGAVPNGRVRVSGAKNAATRLLAASMLTEETVHLGNFPLELVDVRHKLHFAQKMGVEVSEDPRGEVLGVTSSRLDASDLTDIDFDVPIRTTYLLAASQLLRSGVARVPYPGGCQIGVGPRGGRGYDLHVMVWESLGCVVHERGMFLEVEAPGGLRGGAVDFPLSTVGGTENALLCAAVAAGETTISNAYITPEVDDLIGLLRRMGAEIEVTGNSFLRVQGAGGVLSGAHMDVMPDRIEALTWITYALMSRGELLISGVPFHSMEVPLIHLEQAGVDLLRSSDSVYVAPEVLKVGAVQPFELACGTHPGVISDMQPLFVLLGMIASGTSRIFDYRYPARIGFASELAKFTSGGSITAETGKITVHGGSTKLIPAEAKSTDLRGSMALVLAALCAEGNSRVRDVHMALRGYNNLRSKLESLGIPIHLTEE